MTTTTHHRGEIRADSRDDDDFVFVTFPGNAGTYGIEKDELIAIAAAHAAKWPEPQLGRSIYRSVDAHLIAQQEVTRAALAEADRLRRALTHIQGWGTSSHSVAGTPLALYADAALNGGTD